MELNLQNVLFGIKLNDSLFNKNNISTTPAFSYYKTLNIILNKFVSSENSFNKDYSRKYNFSNLQLTIDE
jgi:hypothetical protein